MNSSDYIAMSAVAISICAFLLTIYEGRQSREHQRASVKPKLDIDMGTDGESGKLLFEVENKGLGPAFISKYSVYIDNERMNSTATNLWSDCLEKLGVAGWKYTMYTPTSTSILSPGSRHELFRLKLEPGANNVYELMSRVRIEIEYYSIYKDYDIVSMDGSIQHAAI